MDETMKALKDKRFNIAQELVSMATSPSPKMRAIAWRFLEKFLPSNVDVEGMGGITIIVHSGWKDAPVDPVRDIDVRVIDTGLSVAPITESAPVAQLQESAPCDASKS